MNNDIDEMNIASRWGTFDQTKECKFFSRLSGFFRITHGGSPSKS